MPNCFTLGKYHVYFWSNENLPLEPLHVHISSGIPSENATKLWITKDGSCVLCHNKSRIPKDQLKTIISVIENNIPMIEEMWISRFGKVSYHE